MSSMSASALPHGHQDGASLLCGVLTMSDSRTPAADRSGQFIQTALQAWGHGVGQYAVIPDDPDRVIATLDAWCDRGALRAIICNGGTGIAPRDTTYDAIAPRLEKTIPGFGELFRWLSFQEIGSRAMASRAIGGIYRQTLIFSLPGSLGAVRLAMEKLILPELSHLDRQLRSCD